MRSYTTPDLDTDIGDLRAQVEHDYTQMAIRLQLPKRLDFSHALDAVFAGGVGMNNGSPYETFKDDLLRAAASTLKDEDELQDMLEILTGVWNHFPHSDLDGLSPIEKMRAEVISPDNVSDSYFSLDAKEYAAEIDHEVRSFSEATAKNLLNHLERIGFGKREHQHALSILSDPQKEPEAAGIYLLTKLTDNTRVGKSLTIDDIQPAMRAVMWCENHTASHMPNGHWNSRMSQNIVEQAIAYNTSVAAAADAAASSSSDGVVIVDPLRTLQALAMIHNAISEFSAAFKVDVGLEEATRHLSDWLALVDIHELLVREDLNITALHFLGAARLIAATGDPKRPYRRLMTRLHNASAAQCSSSAFDREVNRIAEKALNAAQDPIMLMPYPGREPRDCIERLAELAPDMKLRSPLNEYFGL